MKWAPRFSPILPDSPRFSPKLSDRISRIVAWTTQNGRPSSEFARTTHSDVKTHENMRIHWIYMKSFETVEFMWNLVKPLNLFEILWKLLILVKSAETTTPTTTSKGFYSKAVNLRVPVACVCFGTRLWFSIQLALHSRCQDRQAWIAFPSMFD